MLILGIDTCCMPASAAVYDGAKIIGEYTLNNGRTHSQKIMPMIAELFNDLGIKPRDIDCFAAAAGPGSFTGVRIGAATIKALARGAERPCAAVSTLLGLANNVRFFDGVICPIMDARRGQVYNALFSGDGSLTRLSPDRAIALSELLSELEGKRALFLGDGVAVHRGEIEERMGERAAFAPANALLNSAASVACAAAEMFEKGETVSYSELVPNYIRLSQAERERKEKLKRETH